ncbi:hypothetical protein J2W39_001681 [Variovorax paradoxus]|uniref:Uncharacterized protein n=1 Tax=Variovorax paradoxus TaxID=34073 RepID=A0AAW8ECD8_VARPD|nr:hypothetical protein [Variovorax paradoxus]MDP9970448.1 hypothetical protein [Variovorax paradoxus]
MKIYSLPKYEAMNFSRRKTPLADFPKRVKGQLWGDFRHKQGVIHRADASRNVVPFGATAQKHSCAQWRGYDKSMSRKGKSAMSTDLRCPYLLLLI